MITIVFCALLAGYLGGRHWSNLLFGGVLGFIIASIIGCFLPVKAIEVKIMPENIWETTSGRVNFIFIDKNKAQYEMEDKSSIAISEYDLLTYKKYYFSDSHSWYWGINYPFWYAYVEVTKETAKKVGIL